MPPSSDLTTRERISSPGTSAYRRRSRAAGPRAGSSHEFAAKRLKIPANIRRGISARRRRCRSFGTRQVEAALDEITLRGCYGDLRGGRVGAGGDGIIRRLGVVCRAFPSDYARVRVDAEQCRGASRILAVLFKHVDVDLMQPVRVLVLRGDQAGHPIESAVGTSRPKPSAWRPRSAELRCP